MRQIINLNFKKILIVILVVAFVLTCVPMKNMLIFAEDVDTSIISININGQDQYFRIISEDNGFTKLMSMFDIGSATKYWNQGQLEKTAFSDGVESTKYFGSNVDNILENWYAGLKTGNLALYRAIRAEKIYQYDAKWSSTQEINGYLTTWLDTTKNFDSSTTTGTYQYILFSNESSIDTFPKSLTGEFRHVYAPCIKDIFEYYGLEEALGANETNRIFFNETTTVDKYVWLRDADSDPSRSTSAWFVVGAFGGIGTSPADVQYADVRAEFVVDLSKVIYKDAYGITHVPVPEGKTLFYTGDEQCGIYGINDYISVNENDYMKSDIGTYNVEVSIKPDCVWSDGSSDTKEISFEIGYPYIGIDINDNDIIEDNEKYRLLSSDTDVKTVLSMYDLASDTSYNSTGSQEYSGSNIDNALNEWYESLPEKTKDAIKDRDIYQYKAEWINDFPYPMGFYTTWMNSEADTKTQEFATGNIYQWLIFSKTDSSLSAIETNGTNVTKKVFAPSIKDIFDIYGVDMAMGAADVRAMFFGQTESVNKSVWLRDMDSNPKYNTSLWTVVGSVGGIGTNPYSTNNSVRGIFDIDLSDIYWTDYTTDYNSKIIESSSDGNVITGIINSNEEIKDAKLEKITEEVAKSILNGGESPIAYEALNNGKEVKIFIEVSSCTDYDGFSIKNLNSENSILLNVDLFATIVGDSANKEKITNTNGNMITVNIELTPDQAEKIIGDNKSYYVLRKHAGEAVECIEATKSIDEITGNHIFTFSTDRFSEYAIYSENKSVYTSDDNYSVKSSKDKCLKDNTCVYARFTDSNTKAWYHDGVHFCVDKGYMNGISKTLFGPDETLSRAMIVNILWNIEKNPTVNYAMSFKDVKAEVWYTEAIRWAVANKIVSGYDEQSYGPKDNVSREQLAAILMNYASYKGIDVSKRADLEKYEDINLISNWALDSVKWANAMDILGGRTNTTIDPKGNATRAEAACMIQRFSEYVLKK